MDLLDLVTHGLGQHDLGVAIGRAAVGIFFAISGFHKLFVPERHARLTRTLEADKVPFVPFMQWWVPFWEFASGVLMAVGLFTVFNAVVLIIVCLVACAAEAPSKVAKYAPINAADKLDDYLYLPEVLYVVMLAGVALGGAGPYSLDAFFFR